MAKFTKQPYIEDVGPRKIESIKFEMLSGSEIRKAAEVQIWNNRTFVENQKPVEHGVYDPRLGPPNSKLGKCATCHGDFKQCPGHFGYLPLTLPVFNYGYIGSIINVLKSICKSCARILLLEKVRISYLKKMRSSTIDAFRKSGMVKEIVTKCKPTACSRCGYVNGIVKNGGNKMLIVHDRKKIVDGTMEEIKSAISGKTESKAFPQVVPLLNPVEVLALFKRMLDEDCEVLYLSDRPEKFIITDVPVPPAVIRPSAFIDATTSNQDDVTSIVRNIISANASLKQDLEKGLIPMQEHWDVLQDHVAQYINSDAKPIKTNQFDRVQTKRSNGLVQRLKGKQGRFRGNLSGKRVEYTGRTVISPDPNLKITEVAIPILMAKILTYPEKVSRHNIEKLRQCVRNGRQKYPGANFIAFPDGGPPRDLNYGDRKRAADELQYGYIVERHIEDGDIVLFNRQPSLHRMSIMAHRARVMPWRTLRFNESVCNPYNADFDGDEMNMHVPQTEEARTEALTLMGVQNNLCTPKNGEILVASTQDFLTSSFLITRKDTFYDRAAFSLMCSYMGDAMDPVDLPTPTIIKPIELWTGKQLFSVLVRPHAHMKVFLNLTVMERTYDKRKNPETMCPNDGFVYFRNSDLISGQLGKVTLGNGNKDGLFSVLLRDYNEYAAAACMNRLAKLSARWIGNHGFSIGINDVQPGEALNNHKKVETEKGYKACDDLIQSYNKGKLQLQPGSDAAQTLEAEISDKLSNIRENAGKICMRELHWRNSPLIMSQCGSKGSSTNISQMIACVGQQIVGGKRTPNGFIDRTLPHFTRKSKTPSAKGFVANSFYSGLTATEFFFHTMAGREGLVDTAVKTAETGYLSRKIMKCLEDLSIHYDNTVRNASGGVVQFIYGDDGMDPAKMEGKDGFPLNFERLFLKIKATCPHREDANLSPSEAMRLVDGRLSQPDMRLIGDRLSQPDMTPDEGCFVTFKSSLSDFLEKHITLLRNTRRSLHLDEDKVENSSEIHEKVAANISGITRKQLEVFLDTCITRYHQKRAEAGIPIGAIGAQSIGEPGTQMTLKTFHFAGLASMNITQGVPRIKEIVNGAKNISTPMITTELEKNDDEKVARIVKGCIEKTVLGQVAKSITEVLTSRQSSIVITLDMETIEALQLEISAYSVRQSISQRTKIKQQNIEVMDCRKLRVIIPPEDDRCKLSSKLHDLKTTTLPAVTVKGIPAVERVVIVPKQEDEKKDKEKEEYKLLTEYTGQKKKVECTTLLSVMGTPGVDGHKTTSNHIIEVQETLGIEAARKSIVGEIQKTMKSHSMNIDVRHMMLLADVMTHTGEVLGNTINGMKKMTKSVFMLASFERSADHLFDASVYGTTNKINGVSECIIMGIPMKMGSGMVKVKQRIQELPKLSYGPDSIIS